MIGYDHVRFFRNRLFKYFCRQIVGEKHVFDIEVCGSDRLVDGFIDEGVKFFDFRLASCRTDFRIVVFLDLVDSGVK